MQAEKTQERARRPNRFSFWRVMGFAAASIVLLAGALVLRENISGPRASAAAKKRWADAGCVLTEDGRAVVALPKVPDDRNFAATPALKGIAEEFAAATRERSTDFGRDAPKLARLLALAPSAGVANPWFTKDWDRPGLEADWKEWRTRLKRSALIDKAGPVSLMEPDPPLEGPARDSDDPRAVAGEVFEALDRDPALIEELALAAERPEAVPFPAPVGGLEPRLNEVADAIGLLARAALASGRTDSAAKCVLIGCRLAELGVKSLPDPVTQRRWYPPVRCLAEGIRDRAWDEASLAKIAPHLTDESDALAPAVVAAWAAVYQSQWLNDATERSRALMRLAGPGSKWTYGKAAPWGETLAALIPHGWWENNAAVSLNLYFDEVLAPARTGGWLGLIDHEAAFHTAQKRVVDKSPRFGLPVHRHGVKEYRDGDFYYGHLRGLGAAMLFAQTAVREMALAVAVERFRLATGGLPENAAEVVPRFLSAVPRDLDGTPLRYVKKDGGFLIYSVGLDKVDDWHGSPPTPADLAEPGFRRESSTPWLKLGPLPEGAEVKDWLFDFSPPAASPTAQ